MRTPINFYPLALLVMLAATSAAAELEPPEVQHVVVVKNVCAWPNLTLTKDGEILAILHNQPAHGTQEGDVECWASRDGLAWKKRSVVTQHDPDTVRMNHAAGLAKNGDFIVLCSGWTNVKQAGRPKQPPFRDGVLRPWIMRSKDAGRTWEKNELGFPAEDDPQWTQHIPFGDIWIGEDDALHSSCYQGKFEDPAKSFRTTRWRSWHIRSDDDGRTWKLGSVIGRRHNETDIFPFGGKSWLAAARIDRMELIRSDDNGKTWGKPVPVTERNEINGHLTRLNDGRLLLSYGVRVKDRRGVCAKLSSDDGRTWSDPLRLAHAIGSADCGYPSSVQRKDGSVVTAWYSKESPQHVGYHMGVTIWRAPGQPAQAEEFKHAGVLDVWSNYSRKLTFGRGQTLALVDDGCKMSMPEWKAVMPDGRPKVLVAHDAVDGDNNPKHEGRGYHGSTIGIPSSVNYGGKWGVAYNNQVAVIRGNECCHCSIVDSRKTLAAALEWVLDHHKEYRITTVNLAPVDDQEHAQPVATEIDAKLAALRKANIWVSAPAGNHNFIKGISWPASQPNCFAIGAVKPGSDDVIFLDRHEKVALLVPARATSSSNAIVCGAAMILREAIEKSEYDWSKDGETLPDAMMTIFQRTGVEVQDRAVSGRVFRRLDLAAAVKSVLEAN